MAKNGGEGQGAKNGNFPNFRPTDPTTDPGHQSANVALHWAAQQWHTTAAVGRNFSIISKIEREIEILSE